MSRINSQNSSFSTFAMFAGAITALIGVFILIGWQINITVFNYSMQGDSPIRANASIAFLLSGISLIILHRHSFATNVLVRFFGLVISLIGIVSLAEALFHIHPVFDNFFTGHSHKSDMFIQEPVYSAINFILIGFSLIFLTLRIKNRFALEFFLILPFSISLMVFLGHLTGLHDLTGIGASAATQMPFISSVTFIILCLGTIFSSYEIQRTPITIEYRLLTGITLIILLIVFIPFFSDPDLRSIREAANLVTHTVNVENRSREILNAAIEIETGERGYLLSGNEKYLEPMEKAKSMLFERLANIRNLTTDNPYQQNELNELDPLIRKRIQLADNLCRVYKTVSHDKSISLFQLGKGEQLSDSIRAVVARMIAEEDRLLQFREKLGNDKNAQSHGVIQISFLIQIFMLSLLFVFVKNDSAGRRRAEKKLKEINQDLEIRVEQRTADVILVEKRYRDMVETSLVGVYSTSITGENLYINDALLQMLDAHTAGEVFGASGFSVYKNPEDRDRFLAQLHENGTVADFEAELVTKKGNVITTLISGHLDKDIITGMILDITERKQTEYLILKQRDLGVELNAIIEPAKLYEASISALLDVTGMEQGSIYLFDKSQSSFNLVFNVGLPDHSIDVAPSYGENSDIAKLLSKNKPIFLVYPEIPEQLTQSVLPEKLLSIAVLPLHQKELLIGCINLISLKNMIIPSYQQKGIETICSLISNAIERIRIEEEIRTINVGLEFQVEERTQQLSAVNVNLKEQITEITRLAHEISLAKAEAEKANFAKSEFLSRMSHELRTPLNSILGFAQLMNMGALEVGHKKSIEHIMKSGKHLLDLINEVLELSRIEAGKLSISLEPVQLRGIILETLDIVNPLALDRNITLELIDSAQNDVFIKADRQKLKQILINIINNAVKYNRVGGSIRIMNEVLSQEPPLPGMVKISISDTGKGIKAEDIHILFDPFQRIGSEISETEGTGLGLAVAKKLTEAMKGIIGVESTEGKGSTFWIELPISEARVAFHNPLPELTQSDANLTDRSGTILYVEDNYSNIELVEQILQTLRPSIRLITEMYGKNAVKCAIDYKPDLIFLDLDLPDIHGAEVLKLLQNRPETAAIPVIILSANAMRHQIDQLMKDGAKKYLTKPIDVLELVKVVDEMIVNKLPVRTT